MKYVESKLHENISTELEVDNINWSQDSTSDLLVYLTLENICYQTNRGELKQLDSVIENEIVPRKKVVVVIPSENAFDNGYDRLYSIYTVLIDALRKDRENRSLKRFGESFENLPTKERREVHPGITPFYLYLKHFDEIKSNKILNEFLNYDTLYKKDLILQLHPT